MSKIKDTDSIAVPPKANRKRGNIGDEDGDARNDLNRERQLEEEEEKSENEENEELEEERRRERVENERRGMTDNGVIEW